MKVPFGPSRQIEIAYESTVAKLMRRFFPAKRPEQSFESWIEELSGLSQRLDFAEFAERAASRMVRWQNIQNAKSWKEAAARSQRSRMLYRILQKELESPLGDRYRAIVRTHADLIRSLPSDIAQRLSGHLAKAQQAGMRHEAIAPMMRAEFPRLASWKINLLARTGVAAAASALTEAKSKEIGLACYEWDTSEDQRVRPSHRLMAGVIVFWDDPPAPEKLLGIRSTLGHYLPGRCPNCRCGSNPLLTVDDVSWPRKVYREGRIERMTRAAFMAISGLERRQAA